MRHLIALARSRIAVILAALAAISGWAAEPLVNPDPFFFPSQAGVGLAVPVMSFVQISGSDAPAPVSVAGGGYSIGCTGTFTTSAGTILPYESVCVSTTSAATYDTQTVLTLTIGAVNGTFRVTTETSPAFAAPIRILGGDDYGVAVRPDGTAYEWGSFTLQTHSVGSFPALELTAVSGVTDMAGGTSHYLVLRTDGSVWSWGENASGQLGDGTTTTGWVPMQVPLDGVAVRVAARRDRSFVIRDDGTLRAWGENDFGQLGDGTTTARSSPVLVPNLASVTAIAVSDRHSLALRNDGTVWAWGDNTGGQIGDGTTTGRSVPTQVSGLAGVIAIAAGDFHSLAVKGDGTVWAWGANGAGQLGDGSAATSLFPVQVPGLAGIVSIAAGVEHSFALRNDGTVWAWGGNGDGQVGDGTQNDRMTPVQVAGLPGVTGIAAGGFHSLAVTSDGGVWAWGRNNAGQLSDYLQGARSTLPIPVIALPEIPYDGLGGASLFNVEPLAFYAQVEVPAGTPRTSNAIRIKAVLPGTTLSVIGGQHSLGCTGSFTPLPASVSGDVLVCLRHAASGSGGTTTSATLTLSGTTSMSRSFSVTTLEPSDILPSAPLNLVAVAGNGLAMLSFSAPANDGGSGVLEYTVTCFGGQTGSVTKTGSPVTLILDNDVEYLCWVVAANANGIGPASSIVTVTPSASVPLSLLAAQSRDFHGGKVFNLPIDTSQGIGGAISVEPRMSNTRQIVLVFNAATSAPVGATLKDAANNNVGGISAATNGNEVVLSLYFVPDNQRVTVSLAGVNGAPVNASVAIGFLVGDVNGSGSVTASDILMAKGRAGQDVNAANYVYDVNRGGSVAAFDIEVVKQSAGLAIP